MPCGASTILMQVKSQNGGGKFDVHTFTKNDLGNVKDIGVDFIADKQVQFRIQAKVSDIKNINCPNPSFSVNFVMLNLLKLLTARMKELHQLVYQSQPRSLE
jgi:hypothetical protein